MSRKLTPADLACVANAARSLARQVAGRLTVDWEDLYQEGLAELLEALPTFEDTRGTWEGFRWQRAYRGMNYYLRRQHIGPQKVAQDAKAAAHARATLEQETGGAVSRVALAAALGWTLGRLARAELGLGMISLDAPADEDAEALTWADRLAEDGPTPEEWAIRADLLHYADAVIAQVRSKLKPHHRGVLDGLLRGETAQQIAGGLGLSEVYVAQITQRVRLRLDAAASTHDRKASPSVPEPDREQMALALLREKPRPLNLLMQATGWSKPIATRLVRDLVTRGLAYPTTCALARPNTPETVVIRSGLDYILQARAGRLSGPCVQVTPREQQFLDRIREQRESPRPVSWYVSALRVSRVRLDQLRASLVMKGLLYATGSIVLTPAGEALATPALARSAA